MKSKLWLKFDDILPDFAKAQDRHIDQLEQITDDFSVAFAEFLRAKTANTKGGGYKLFSDGEQYTLKELLQHFKTNIYGK
jgi:hypothetical protein